MHYHVTAVWICAAIGVLILIVLLKKPFLKLMELFCTTAIGWCVLSGINLLLAPVSFSIGINAASATVTGVLGLPGLVLLLITKYIYK